jgi:hypothetical protein
MSTREPLAELQISPLRRITRGSLVNLAGSSRIYRVSEIFVQADGQTVVTAYGPVATDGHPSLVFRGPAPKYRSVPPADVTKVLRLAPLAPPTPKLTGRAAAHARSSV